MDEKLRDLGVIKLVQLQPSGLIIETPSGYFYDASRRVEVDSLLITSKGIEATTSDGEHVLNIHHRNRDGVPFGNIMAAGYGHTLGPSVDFNPVDDEGETVTVDCIKSGSYKIDIPGVLYPATTTPSGKSKSKSISRNGVKVVPNVAVGASVAVEEDVVQASLLGWIVLIS